MSHSGLVRLPAKEVGVEAPREFESPHLRKSESPSTQHAGALVVGPPVLFVGVACRKARGGSCVHESPAVRAY